MMPTPAEFRWQTQYGRELDIRWMDTQHLTNSVNMVIRKNDLDRRKVEAMVRTPQVMPGNLVFVNMVKELQARYPLEWTFVKRGVEESDQITCDTLVREDLKTMCLLRAMLDTNIHWPQVVERHVAMRALRLAPESVFLSIEQHRVNNPHPDLFRLLAKFTEYRLCRT